jgi:3-oxoacyl-[acyl-carrier-protein] synthase-3
MRATILGMGEWLPDTIRGNDAWPPDFASRAAASADRELADAATISDDRYGSIVARHVAAEAGDPFLGSSRRRVADESTTSWEAEAMAAGAAVADAHIDARDIDCVLSWTLTPDRPGQVTAPRVAHEIGASRAVGAGTPVACASGVMQLMLSAALIESGRARFVLLTQSNLAVRTFPFGHPASPSVGDAATAFIVGPSEQPGILALAGVSHGDFHDAVVWRRHDETPWYQAGGPMYLGSHDRTAARQLVRDTVRFGAETVTEAARRSGVPVSSIDVLASVQPRRWVPGAIAEALGLPPETAPQTFDDLAHLGASGVITNLLEARRRGMLRARPDGNAPTVCLYAQGAGFTRLALLVRWGV